MTDPFIAEIRLFPFNFAPRGWAFCDGQLLPISQNTALFSLLGTFYGGNGTSTFALPDLQGCVPVHPGQGPGLSDRVLGETGGSSAVTLLESEVPVHTHALAASAAAAFARSPSGELFANQSGGVNSYAAPGGAPAALLAAASLGPSGGNQPHNNLAPYLVVNFCIALQGIYPPRT
ncbi:phage tail protein [Oryzobacter sp. R7]|uniref:phage tail protein n=1 Tax=Oryzobacter faecalis TaxID=3388656 RepID=UPI00398D53F8